MRTQIQILFFVVLVSFLGFFIFEEAEAYENWTFEITATHSNALRSNQVTYTYTLENTGDVPYSASNPADENCSPIEFVGGDVDGDGLVDPGEIWVWECITDVSETTTSAAYMDITYCSTCDPDAIICSVGTCKYYLIYTTITVEVSEPTIVEGGYQICRKIFPSSTIFNHQIAKLAVVLYLNCVFDYDLPLLDPPIDHTIFPDEERLFCLKESIEGMYAPICKPVECPECQLFTEAVVSDKVLDSVIKWQIGDLSDKEFTRQLQKMVISKDIQIGAQQEKPPIRDETGSVPLWIKQNAGWWSQGLISDEEFVNGIQYLINEGIITMPNK